MQEIPLNAIPSQLISVVLGGQNCQINIAQKATGVYLDLSINGAYIVRTRICMDRVTLIKSAYLGFIGNLMFVDTQGGSDPDYTGMGQRFRLVYIEASDI